MARVHSGDPSLYGATAEQMRRLDALGVDYELLVPGVKRVPGRARRPCGFEYTPAGKTQTVILTRASGNTGVPEGEDLLEAVGRRTARRWPCISLSAAQMPEVVAALTPHYGPDAPVVVAYRVSWPDERILRCTLTDLAARMAEAGITRTALILIGPMLDDPSGRGKAIYTTEPIRISSGRAKAATRNGKVDPPLRAPLPLARRDVHGGHPPIPPAGKHVVRWAATR